MSTVAMVILNEAYILECRNVSNIRVLKPSKWYNRFCGSKVAAQFLKEVSIIVRSGEIHGIIGNAGSGKTTLLKVIAGRCSGEFTGNIMLNQRQLTRQLFDSTCAIVNFNQPLIETISTCAMLKFQAGITICGLNDREIEKRIASLVRDFDLTAYCNVPISNLNEAARRRLLLCMRLINDPILILLDEPTEGLNALCSYQLMYSLSLYIKKTQKMAIVATRIPRSDLYQLFNRLTILFYGETIYSGITKELPLYFRRIGFPCPINENPAIYYLSFATIDRETTKRYRETQEQALKLIDLFKIYEPRMETFQHVQLSKPLCFYGKPHKSIVCGQSDEDITDGVYSRILSVVSFLFASAPNDLFAFISSILIISLWHFNSLFSGNWNYIWDLMLPLWCCYQHSQILTLIIIFYAKSAESTVTLLIEFCFGSIVCAGSLFLSEIKIFSSAPRTFLSPNDWRHILMHINFYRYVLSFTNFKFLDGETAGSCANDESRKTDNDKRLEQFCRWSNGTVFLNEHYPEMWNYSVEAFNYYSIISFTAVTATIALLCFKFSKSY
uniref:ABC transporter domain-containing protein n=1 Tax=Setaria digitata TaxID=48799 RepID=A0A915PZ15_9BILA